MVQAIIRNQPVDTPFTKLFLQRMFKDQLNQMVDPQANQKFRQAAKRLKERTGQEFYWKPGSTSPRAPNINNIFGGQE